MKTEKACKWNKDLDYNNINDNQSNGKDDLTEYTREEIEGFKTVFNTFDKHKSGHVSIEDLRTIFESLGRNSTEFNSILTELELSHLKNKDMITFDQFVMIMQMLEKEMDKGEHQLSSDHHTPYSGSNNMESDVNERDSYNLDLK